MTVHVLRNDTVEDVMIVIGGKATDHTPRKTSTVVLSGGRECTNHGIPEAPNEWINAGHTIVHDYMIVRCGGLLKSGSSFDSKHSNFLCNQV